MDRSHQASTIRPLNPRIFVMVCILLPLNGIVMNLLFRNEFFQPVSRYTNYIIQPTLCANMISIIVFAFIILFLGRLNLISLRLSFSKFKESIGLIFILWFSAQTVSVIAAGLSPDGISVNNDFNILVGSFLGQIFGNALFEEAMYRGLIYIQLYLILRKKKNNKISIFIALVCSQLLFSLIHIPNRLWINQSENLLLDLVNLFILGAVFTIIFIRTDNLAFLIGFHALLNEPFDIIKPSIPTQLIILLGAIIIAILWPLITCESRRIKPWRGNSYSKKSKSSSNVPIR